MDRAVSIRLSPLYSVILRYTPLPSVGQQSVARPIARAHARAEPWQVGIPPPPARAYGIGKNWHWLPQDAKSAKVCDWQTLYKSQTNGERRKQRKQRRKRTRTGNGERGKRGNGGTDENGERGTENGERRTGNGERGTDENGVWRQTQTTERAALHRCQPLSLLAGIAAYRGKAEFGYSTISRFTISCEVSMRLRKSRKRFTVSEFSAGLLSRKAFNSRLAAAFSAIA